MPNFDANYWNNRYKQGKTGWDIGYASPAITDYAKQITNKNIKVLIPGCGNAHEAESLLNLGFTNITIIDFAAEAIKNTKQKYNNYINNGMLNIVCDDFFNDNHLYDLVLEQTFFCALNPILRSNYAKHMHNILNTNGTLAGLFFNFELTEEGPPFGGSIKEYETYFKPFFTIKTFEPSYNSIKPREGRELFAILKKT